MDKPFKSISIKYRHLLSMLIGALLIGAVAAPASARSNYYGPSIKGPLSARVLLLVPEGFDRYAYTSLIGGRETVHLFGRDATEELSAMLAPAFRDLAVWRVATAAEAMDMLSPENPRNAEVLGFDYVAVPRFSDVNARPGAARYRFEIDIVLDVYATDGSKVTAVRGYGESTTGNWFPGTPLDAGHLALTKAVEAIRDGIEGRRSLFAAAPRSRYAEAPPAPRQPFDRDIAPVENPIPVRVLVLVPDEFSRFVHTSSARGREVEHLLGRHAEERFKRALGPQFRYLAFRPVTSEAAARDMLSPDNPDHAEVTGYDYVAVPRFSKVNAWSERSNYGVEVDMLVEFYSTDGSREIKFQGYGNHINGLYGPVETVEVETGDFALNSAVKAIRESIERRRDAFVS